MKRKSRILHLGNNLTKHTNYETMLGTLSKLLISEGYTVTVSSDKKNKVLRMLDMIFSILKYKNKVDFVFIATFSTQSFYYTLICSVFCQFFNLKYIPILHGGNLPNRIKRSPKISNLIFSKSHINIAPSTYLKYNFEKQGYKTKYIPNIIEISRYKYKRRINPSPNILWVRAFKQIYNPTLAIRVLREVKKTYPKAKLCMIGPKSEESYDETLYLIEKYSLTKDVEITGVLDKETWLEKSEDYDILINTTNFDNTPVSIIENMALGLYIVSTNVGGMPFLVENEKDAYLVEPDNEVLMANTIIKVLQKPEVQVIDNARKKAESFDWNNVKKQWEDLIRL